MQSMYSLEVGSHIMVRVQGFRLTMLSHFTIVENLICDTRDQLNDEEAREVIGSFLEGKPPGYPKIEAWVWQVVRRRGWGRLSREDIAQDTLIAITENLRKGFWRSDSSLKTYVQRIAFIKCAQALRQTLREDMVMGGYSLLQPKATADNPERDMLDKEQMEILQDVWMELSDRCREVLFAKGILRQSYKEIAPKLGITESFCKKVKHECLKRAIGLYSKKDG